MAGYDYLNESKGEVHGSTILPESIDWRANVDGSFKVDYVTEFFYACDCITTKHPQEMGITFKIDFNTGEAMFSGIDLPERGPDEF